MKVFELLPRPLGNIFRKLTHLTCNSPQWCITDIFQFLISPVYWRSRNALSGIAEDVEIGRKRIWLTIYLRIRYNFAVVFLISFHNHRKLLHQTFIPFEVAVIRMEW